MVVFWLPSVAAKPLSARLFGWVSALALMLAMSPALAGQPVKVGCVEFPPLSYTGQDGRPAGKAMDLLTTILNRAGLNWDARCYPGARLMASLKDGSAQVAMLIRHPDIADHVLYGRLPMAYLLLDAYSPADRQPLAGMDGLPGKSVILLRGYGYGGWIDFFKDPANGIQVNYADSRAAAFKMLASRHGDYLIDYRGPADRALAEAGAPQLRREELVRLETYFVVSRKAPEAERLLWRLEEGFKVLGARPVE